MDLYKCVLEMLLTQAWATGTQICSRLQEVLTMASNPNEFPTFAFDKTFDVLGPFQIGTRGMGFNFYHAAA